MSTRAQFLLRAGRRERDTSGSAHGKEFWSYLLGNSVALLFGLSVAYVALLHDRAITADTIKTGDFIAYYAGAHLVVTGHASHLYDFGALSRLQTSLLHPLVVREAILLPYLYPSFLAVLMAPLAALPYTFAYVLWLTVNCIAMVGAMFVLEKYSGLTGRSAMVARLASIASLPVLLSLFNGQTSIVLLALFTLCFMAARSNHDLLAGAALALATIKVQYVFPFLLIFLIMRRWRLLAAFAVSGLALLTLPMTFLGTSLNGGYLNSLLKATSWQSQYGYAPARNDSLSGFLQLLLTSGPSNLIRLTFSLILVTALCWAAWRSNSLDGPFGLAVTLALLISPHVLTHDLALLLIPAAILLRSRGSNAWAVPALLTLGYFGVAIGYFLVYTTHLQIATLVLIAFTLCSIQAMNRQLPEADTRSPIMAAPVQAEAVS